MKLQTKRLELRKFTKRDAKFVYRLMNTPGWLEFIGDRNIDSIKAAEDYISERFIPMYKHRGCGFWCVSELVSGHLVGTISMIRRDYLDEIDLGFAFLPEFTRQGYAYEASVAILNKEKNESGLESVLAFTEMNNQRSRALLNRLGFDELGPRVLKKEWGESLLYRLTL